MRIKKGVLFFFFYLLLQPCSQGWAQLSSGIYSKGLHIAFDSAQQIITGYFEDYSGYDEELKQPKFSCVFFIYGFVNDGSILIKTYHPFEQKSDTIAGSIKIINEYSFEMKIDEEHGGCWNVSHFATEPIVFNMEEKIDALQVSYSMVPEMKIYSDITSNKIWVASIKNNRVFFVEEKQKEWCRILVIGNPHIHGWVSEKDLWGFKCPSPL